MLHCQDEIDDWIVLLESDIEHGDLKAMGAAHGRSLAILREVAPVVAELQQRAETAEAISAALTQDSVSRGAVMATIRREIEMCPASGLADPRLFLAIIWARVRDLRAIAC